MSYALERDLLSFFFTHDKEAVMAKSNNYGFFHFLFDIVMICLTCGAWLIWMWLRDR